MLGKRSWPFKGMSHRCRLSFAGLPLPSPPSPPWLSSACSGGGKPAAPPVPQVTVAVPLQRDVVDWDEYVGRFEAIQDVELRPRVSGTIDRVLFDQRPARPRGPTALHDRPAAYAAALGQAQAQVAKANAALINARSELARADKLLAAQAISKEEYETKQANVRSAAADLAAGQANVSNARLNLGFTTVRSPITGLVSDRRVSKGNFATEGTTVLTRVVSTDPIWFSFEGAESFYLKYLRQDRKGERGSSREHGQSSPGPACRRKRLSLARPDGIRRQCDRHQFGHDPRSCGHRQSRRLPDARHVRPRAPARFRHLSCDARPRRGDHHRPDPQARLCRRQGRQGDRRDPWRPGRRSRACASSRPA